MAAHPPMASRSRESLGIPIYLRDAAKGTIYERLTFFGKGFSSRCYVVKNCKTNSVYAAKVVRKDEEKKKLRLLTAREILVHSSLAHKHVVQFHTSFDDPLNVYIILEICKSRSMRELQERRITISEPETRYYMHQILLGVQYLHNKHIIHRDLKLGNLFLDDNLQVKIGDFGFSVRIEEEGQKRKSVLGTPDYMAPEIVMGMGYSFEVDIWSLGCIMYTLLVGKSPFEATTMKEKFRQIRLRQYSVPTSMSEPARAMVLEQLQLVPTRRTPVFQLLRHEFFTSGLMPAALPLSCLTTAPRTDQLESVALPAGPSTSRNTSELRSNEHKAAPAPAEPMTAPAPAPAEPMTAPAPAPAVPMTAPAPAPAVPMTAPALAPAVPMTVLRDQLAGLLANKLGQPECLPEELSDPAAGPLVWVSRWADCSDKYGFGYNLCDDSVGMIFNDGTKIMLHANGLDVTYIDGVETYFKRTGPFPPTHDMEKKRKLLEFFTRFMSSYLVPAGGSAAVPVRESDGLSRLPHVIKWKRYNTSIMMYISNGSLQVNFNDHTKIIVCPLMKAVTYIDGDIFRTYRFATIEEHGCEKKLHFSLSYALQKLNLAIAADGQ